MSNCWWWTDMDRAYWPHLPVFVEISYRSLLGYIVTPYRARSIHPRQVRILVDTVYYYDELCWSSNVTSHFIRNITDCSSVRPRSIVPSLPAGAACDIRGHSIALWRPLTWSLYAPIGDHDPILLMSLWFTWQRVQGALRLCGVVFHGKLYSKRVELYYGSNYFSLVFME